MMDRLTASINYADIKMSPVAKQAIGVEEKQKFSTGNFKDNDLEMTF